MLNIVIIQDKIKNGNIYISSSESESSSKPENDNENNEDVGVIYIDSNEENDLNLFQDEDNMDESDME